MINKSFKKVEFGIIGGGFTGLVVALRLAQAGFKVSIYEKTENFGGLASGFAINDSIEVSNSLISLSQNTHEVSGEKIKLRDIFLEKTYHHIFRTDQDIISLAKEMGVSNRLSWYQSSMSIYWDGKLYPFNGASDLLRFYPISFFSRLRLGFVTLFLQKFKDYKIFEKYTALEWMAKWAGKESVKVIWQPLLKGKFSELFYDKVSMAWLWARIHIRANSRVSGQKELLGYFDSGFNVLVDALLKRLKELDVSLIQSCEIQDIEIIRDKHKELRYSLHTSCNNLESEVGGKNIKIEKVGKGVTTYNHDFIVATVPSSVFGKLFGKLISDKSYLEKLSLINYIGAICLIFTTSQKLSKTYWYNINDENSPFLVFINHTALVPKEHYGGRFVYYIAGYYPHDHDFFSYDDEKLKELWFEGLKDIFPDFLKQKIYQSWIWKFKYAQHIVDNAYPTKIPSYLTPLKNVFLSNFSQIYPEDRGTNYAVREGNKLASEIISSMN